jgi:hypothetical protein
MTKWIALPAAFAAAAALTVSVEAAPKANAKSTSPKTTTTTKAPATTSQGASTKTKGSSPKSTSAKADHSGGSKAKGPKTTKTGTSTTAKGNGSSKKSGTTSTASTATTTTTTTTSTGTEWKPTNAVAEKLMTKPNQLAKLKAVIGDTVDINDATAGFKNFGQLNAAVNVSQNLGIEFSDLKAAMTGITIDGEKTNQPTKSLGQAIQQFKPGVDADSEAAAATRQATRDGGQ